MRIGEMVSLVEYKKLQEIARGRLDTINDMQSTMIKARGVLNAPFTLANLRNATAMLENLPTREYMQKYVIKWILKSAKKPNTYCKIVKDKCIKEGRRYCGFNNEFYTFNYLKYWFVYDSFKERAIRENPTSFSFRFRDALVAFILDQQKYSGNRVNR